MFKKLLAKLTGAEWPPQQQPSAADKFSAEQQIEKELSKERQQAQQDRMRQEREGQWEEVQIPEGQEPKSSDSE